MRYFVSRIVDAATGQRYVLGLARVDDDTATTELYSVD